MSGSFASSKLSAIEGYIDDDHFHPQGSLWQMLYQHTSFFDEVPCLLFVVAAAQ
jgi:hypothetical protein